MNKNNFKSNKTDGIPLLKFYHDYTKKDKRHHLTTVKCCWHQLKLENCPQLKIEVRPTALGLGVKVGGWALEVGI